jgi:Maltose acetyltransferase
MTRWMPNWLKHARGGRNLCLDLNATREEQQEERRRILTGLFGAGGETVWIDPVALQAYQ